MPFNRSVLRFGAVGLSLLLAACATDSPTGPTTTTPAFTVSANQLSSSPVLLSCPSSSDRSSSKVIGPKGGSLTVAGTTVRIPAGAVPEPTEFTITLPASEYLEVQVSAAGYEHYTFASPVRITIGYARCRAAANASEALSAWYLDPETGKPVKDMGGVDSKRAKAITFETDHLSGYAISW